MLASVAVQTVLLVLKIAFLVFLYLFIWRIVRSAGRDVRLPQESFVLGAAEAQSLGLRREPVVSTGTLVVLKSDALREGETFELDTAPLSVGRAENNDIALDGDEFASSKHARIEPRRDGVWVEDTGSTNGTYLNGVKLDRPRRLTPGDVVRVGGTDLRYDQ